MKSAPKAPKPIDPAVAGAAQEKASINTAIAQQALNQTSQSSPFGSTQYNQTGTVNVDGNIVPTYGVTSSLSAPLQSLLDTGLSGANSAASNYSTALSGLPHVGDPNLLNQQTIDALYGQATSRLDPQWDTRQREYENRLAEQGIPLGTEAYTNAMRDFNLARNDAYTSAQNAATQAGVQDASQLYQDALAGRQQGISEATQPISNLASIMALINGGQSASQQNTPGVSVQTPDILGAYNTQAQQQQNAYNAQMQQYGSTLGGLGGLAGNALMFALL